MDPVREQIDKGISLYRRGRTWWLDVHRDGDRHRKNLGTASLPKARTIARELAGSILAGKWNVKLAGVTSLGRAVELFQSRSIKEECLDRHILFGERSLRHVLAEYVEHYHRERNHQGRGNTLLFPEREDRVPVQGGHVRFRERLGGMLKFYYREAG